MPSVCHLDLLLSLLQGLFWKNNNDFEENQIIFLYKEMVGSYTVHKICFFYLQDTAQLSADVFFKVWEIIKHLQ